MALGNAAASRVTQALGPRVVSGYVFFPKGNYNQVEMVLVDPEKGATKIVLEPWH